MKRFVIYLAGAMTAAIAMAAIFFFWLDNSYSSSVSVPATRQTGWSEVSVENPLTGSKTTEYAAPMETLAGPSGMLAWLRLRCRKEGVQALIAFSSFFSRRYTFWTWAEEGKILDSAMGSPSSNGNASIVDNAEMAKRLLRVIEKGREVRIHVRVADGPPEIFLKPAMSGAERAMTKLSSQCGIPPLQPPPVSTAIQVPPAPLE